MRATGRSGRSPWQSTTASRSTFGGFVIATILSSSVPIIGYGTCRQITEELSTSKRFDLSVRPHGSHREHNLFYKDCLGGNATILVLALFLARQVLDLVGQEESEN